MFLKVDMLLKTNSLTLKYIILDFFSCSDFRGFGAMLLKKNLSPAPFTDIVLAFCSVSSTIS
jgi:hypothetical protein